MLKQWLLSDGKADAITVEEKYTRWTEQLRTDRYVTASHRHLLLTTHVKLGAWGSGVAIKVTKLQLYKIYGRKGAGKKFVDELLKGHPLATGAVQCICLPFRSCSA